MLNCRLNLLLHQCWDWCCCIQYDAKMVFIAHGNNFDAIPETMSYCCSQIHHHRHGLSDLRNDLKQMLVFFTVNDAVWLDDFQRFLVGGSILVIHWLNCYFQMFDRHQRWELFYCSCLDSLDSPFLRYYLRSLQSRPRVRALENANSTLIDSYSQRKVWQHHIQARLMTDSFNDDYDFADSVTNCCNSNFAAITVTTTSSSSSITMTSLVNFRQNTTAAIKIHSNLLHSDWMCLTD